MIDELVLVGDLTEVDGGDVLEVWLDLSSKLIESTSLLEEGHEEVDLALFREEGLGDFKSFNSVGHEHEARREDNNVEFVLRVLGHIVEVHLLDLHILVRLEDLLRSRQVVRVDINSNHLHVIRNSLDDGVQRVASAYTDVQNTLE